MGDLDLYQRKDALPHSYTLKRDEPDNTREQYGDLFDVLGRQVW